MNVCTVSQSRCGVPVTPCPQGQETRLVSLLPPAQAGPRRGQGGLATDKGQETHCPWPRASVN